MRLEVDVGGVHRRRIGEQLVDDLDDVRVDDRTSVLGRFTAVFA